MNKLPILAIIFISVVAFGYNHLRAVEISQEEINQLTGDDNLGVTVLMVPNGGTGATSFGAGLCLVGNGTGAVTTSACGAGGGLTTTAFRNTAPITLATTSSLVTYGITQSDTSTDGYLSSTDWNTFNNKWDGLNDMALAQGNFYIGNSSNNPVATNSLYMDSAGNIGIGSTSPEAKLTVTGDIIASGIIHTEDSFRMHLLSTPATLKTGHTSIYSYNSGGNDTTDTTLLLHFDDTGSGNPINSGFNATATTTNNGTTQQTATVKFVTAALQLDSATTEWVDINGMFTTDAGGWSIDWWAYVNDLSADRPMLSAGDGTGANYMQFLARSNNDFRFRLRVGNTNRVTINSPGAILVTGQWAHFRVERTGNTYYAYVNGINTGNGTWTGGDPTALTDWEIGRNDPEGGANYFDGFIDEMRVYMDSGNNFNGTDFTTPSAPYDTSVPWYVDEKGNRQPLASVQPSAGLGSFWNKLTDDSLVYEVNEKNRFLIPPQGADFATQNYRSFMLSGLYQDAGDEVNSYTCSANGFFNLDCDTGGTGADLGVQDDVQVLGTIYAQEELVVATTTLVTLNGQVGINDASPSFTLDVNGTFQVTASTTFNGVELLFPASLGSVDQVLAVSSTDGKLKWATAGSFLSKSANDTTNFIITAKGLIATSTMEIPNGTAPTTDSVGEIAIDTTSDQFVYYGGAKRVLFYEFDKSFWAASTSLDASYNSYSTATTSWKVWNTKRAVTLTDLYCKTDTGISLLECGDGTNMTETIICDSDGQEDDGSITNGTFIAREDFLCEVDGNSSTSNKTTLTATFVYTSD